MTIKYLLVCSLFAAVSACGYADAPVIPSIDASVMQGAWREQTELHAQMLLKIGEKSISEPSGVRGETTIRFSWSRPFHPHVVVKLSINSEKQTAVATTWVIDRNKGDGSAVKSERSVDYGRVGEIRAAIDLGGFGNLAPLGSMVRGEVSSWFIEMQNGTYWAVCRNAPIAGDLVYTIGRQMLESSIGSELLPVY